MAEPLAAGWNVQKLRPEHDRAGFTCGHPSLDDFIRKFAGQNAKSGVSQTYVAIRDGQTTVLGYYALSAGSVSFDELPPDRRKRLPRYPVPVAHLGRLAVDVRARGQRLGELLLLDAFSRIVAVADAVGIHAVEVVAIDDQAASFYARYGFVRLADDPHHLYLPMATIRSLKL